MQSLNNNYMYIYLDTIMKIDKIEETKIITSMTGKNYIEIVFIDECNKNVREND